MLSTPSRLDAQHEGIGALIGITIDYPAEGSVFPMTRGLALAPDGSYTLYSQLDRWGQDLMLVEIFR